MDTRVDPARDRDRSAERFGTVGEAAAFAQPIEGDADARCDCRREDRYLDEETNAAFPTPLNGGARPRGTDGNQSVAACAPTGRHRAPRESRRAQEVET
jgi:hypothetical protein